MKPFLVGIVLMLAGPAAAETPAPMPYRLWWSFPRDDRTAIEVDEPDLHVSGFATKWELVAKQGACDETRAARLMLAKSRGDATPLRELRVESLDGAGAVHATTRCVLPLQSWRRKLGERLVERLEDELDAHSSFLSPRKTPSQTMPKPEPDAGKR